MTPIKMMQILRSMELTPEEGADLISMVRGRIRKPTIREMADADIRPDGVYFRSSPHDRIIFVPFPTLKPHS